VEDIDTYVDNQIAAGLSPATINRRLASLHAFFEYLASEKPERDWPNPVIRRRHRLKAGSHLPRDVPDDDVAQLFAVISDERDRARQDIGRITKSGSLMFRASARSRWIAISAASVENVLSLVLNMSQVEKERLLWIISGIRWRL
jgi:site-specific recombinase XerD